MRVKGIRELLPEPVPLRVRRPSQEGAETPRAGCFYFLLPLVRKNVMTAPSRSNMMMVAGQLSAIAAACGYMVVLHDLPGENSASPVCSDWRPSPSRGKPRCPGGEPDLGSGETDIDDCHCLRGEHKPLGACQGVPQHTPRFRPQSLLLRPPLHAQCPQCVVHERYF